MFLFILICTYKIQSYHFYNKMYINSGYNTLFYFFILLFHNMNTSTISKDILISCNYKGLYHIDCFLVYVANSEPNTINGSYLIKIDNNVYFAVIIFDDQALVFNCAQSRLRVPPELDILTLYSTVTFIQGEFINDLTLCFGTCLYFIKQYMYLYRDHELISIVNILFPKTTFENHRLNIIDFLKVNHPIHYGHLK